MPLHRVAGAFVSQHKDGVVVMTPPKSAAFGLVRGYYDISLRMEEPHAVVLPLDEAGERMVPVYSWVFGYEDIRRAILYFRRRIGTAPARRLASVMEKALNEHFDLWDNDYLPGGRDPRDRTDGLGRGIALAPSRQYHSFSRQDNAQARRVVASCRPVLKASVGLTSGINCGTEGCVYRTDRTDSRGRRLVVKVSVGGHDEIDHHLWRLAQGERSHASLPRIRRVRRLGDCAQRVGVREAYLTVRENLESIHPTPAARLAMRLLEKHERYLHRQPRLDFVSIKRAHDQFEAENEAALRAIHRSPVAWRMWTNIAGLQHWLARRGALIFDLRLANLGIRRPGLLGEPFNVVVRDIGRLTMTPTEHRRHSGKAHGLPRLGAV